MFQRAQTTTSNATKTFQGSQQTKITAMKSWRYAPEMLGRSWPTASTWARQVHWEANMPNDNGESDPNITVAEEYDPADAAVISDGLRAYYVERAGYYDFRPLAVFVRDPQTGKVVGGLHGRSEFGLVYVAWFFLPENLRGARIGSRHWRWLRKWQAARLHPYCSGDAQHRGAGLLQKTAYDVVATIDCEPPGLTRYYMMKKL
jgi:hypothetical protein